MNRTARFALATLSPWILSALVGCSAAGTPEESDVDSVAAALELEDGGFDAESPEAPMFGMEDFESWFSDVDPLTVELAGERVDAADPAGTPDEDACAHGRLQGRYRELRDGVGVGRGRVVGPEGRVLGHIRFIWGTRRDGTKVAFGKLIDLEGNARGVFRGVADDGEFHGQWLRRNGNHGVMAGRYGDPRRLPGGIFLGRWHRVECDDADVEDGF